MQSLSSRSFALLALTSLWGCAHTGVAGEQQGAQEVTIASEPTGAEVYLDNKFIGVTPVRFEDQGSAYGQVYRLNLVKPGYRPRTETLAQRVTQGPRPEETGADLGRGLNGAALVAGALGPAGLVLAVPLVIGAVVTEKPEAPSHTQNTSAQLDHQEYSFKLEPWAPTASGAQGGDWLAEVISQRLGSRLYGAVRLDAKGAVVVEVLNSWRNLGPAEPEELARLKQIVKESVLTPACASHFPAELNTRCEVNWGSPGFEVPAVVLVDANQVEVARLPGWPSASDP